MTFQNFVCWDISRVRDVMNTNAELASRDIFLAVHSEYPLTMSSPTVGDPEAAPQWTLDPHEFLREFLSQEKFHVQVVVLGASGSGKSHLIRWMELNIPDEPGRHVISIPRSGISLRGIIERILIVLPELESQPYRDRLEQAGDERSTAEQFEERLLSEIALAIGRDESLADGNPDLEGELIEQLPNLFHDPYLRRHFRQAGGVVGQLVNQVLSFSTEYVPTEDPREFSIEDLPLTGIQTANMSGAARDIADFLRVDVESQALAVEIINRNLNRAIGQVLNFTGDRLIQLLSDVRRHLRKQGQELVLLIQDLARMQGLDLALLDALIEEGSNENGLCTLRWAAAVTTGYYSRAPDTVKTRMNFVLHMDLPTGGKNRLVDEGSMVTFAARYLNAVRLNPEALNAWARSPDEDRGNPPIACETCPHRTPCHSAFGAVDGIGLYPFNRNALLNMLRRLDSRLDERFNPRVLVKDVLAEVFGTYGRDLANDRFPPGQFLSQMGRQELLPVVGDELRRQHPEHAERQLAVLELWGTLGGKLIDLVEDLYSAFGLPKPSLDEVLGRGPGDRPDDGPTPPEPPEARGDPILDAIRAWGNGHHMQDLLLNTVRPWVYESVVGHIDWDIESMVQSQFAQATGSYFRRDSIRFRGQLTQARPRDVTLQIPIRDGPEALAEAAMALDGLHQFRRHGNWNFPGSHRLLEAFANCLDDWSKHVVAQLNRLPETDGKWNPVAAAVELLAIGAALGGRPPHASATLPEYLSALFEEWPPENSAQSPEWRALYEAVRNDQSRLQDLALGRASGTKGGQRGAFIDPSKVLPALRQVRRRWELAQRLPDELTNRRADHGTLVRLHTRVVADLSSAARTEWRRRTEWVDDWRREVPPGIARKDVVDAVRELLELVVKQGIGVRRQVRDSIVSALAELEAVQLDDALRMASTLREAEDPVRQLPELGRDRGGNVMAVVGRFLPAIREFMAEVGVSVQDRLDNLDEGERGLQEYQTQIRDALTQLSRDLEALGGMHANVG